MPPYPKFFLNHRILAGLLRLKWDLPMKLHMPSTQNTPGNSHSFEISDAKFKPILSMCKLKVPRGHLACSRSCNFSFLRLDWNSSPLFTGCLLCSKILPLEQCCDASWWSHGRVLWPFPFLPSQFRVGLLEPGQGSGSGGQEMPGHCIPILPSYHRT